MPRTDMPITSLPRSGASFILTAGDEVNGVSISPSTLLNARVSTILCLFRTAQVGVQITVPAGPAVDDDLLVASRVISLTPNQTYIWPLRNVGIYLQGDGKIWFNSNGPYQTCFLST